MQLVTSVDKLPPGSWIEFEVFGSPAILLNDNGTFRAFLNICPHRGGSMVWEKESNRFRCTWHESLWSAEGDRLGGPAEEGTCLTPVRVEAKNGYVYAEG